MKTLLQNIAPNYYLRKKVIQRFREHGACTEEFAKGIADLEGKRENYDPISKSALNTLIRKRIIVRSAGDTYFLDERGLMQARMNFVKWGMILFMLLLIMVFLQVLKR